MLLAVTLSLLAQSSDLLAPVSRVAAGLTDNKPSDALAAIDKSFGGYRQLQEYFSGISDAFLITNEVDVLDQNQSGNEASLNLRWTLTLTSQGRSESLRRTETVHVQLARKDRKWKIVDLQPISLFNPEVKRREK